MSSGLQLGGPPNTGLNNNTSCQICDYTDQQSATSTRNVIISTCFKLQYIQDQKYVKENSI